MQFALLGDHPDGLGMALALVHSGRHALATYTGPPDGLETLRRHGASPHPVGDLEEVLADPAIHGVIVAGKRADRSVQLRRVLQSERHALCVPFADDRLDVGYEASLLQGDTHAVLLPLLPEALHPGVIQLGELVERALGELRLVEMERWSMSRPEAEPVPLAALPGWDVLRVLGGDITEVLAFTTTDELTTTRPVLLSGRFKQGSLLRALFLPGQAEPRLRLALIGSEGRAELVFTRGWSGPARLTWQDSAGTCHEETWDAWDPWPLFVERFEKALSNAPSVSPSWQDALRALELDDAVRRSVRYRRVSTLEYPEASEEVGFKGTMTLVGCGMLWGILLLLIVSIWVPWLGWLIVPALVFFLGLQALRWAVPGKEKETNS